MPHTAEQKREYRKTAKGKAVKMFHAAKSRADKKGLEHDLSIKWLVDKLEVGVCEATGLPFCYEIVGHGPRNPFCPSLDRKDCSKGYTKDNVQVVVWMYNAAKGTWGHDYVLALVEALKYKE